MRLEALIFDVDGTLADTEDAHRCAFNAAFEEHALDWNWSKPKYADLLLTAGGKERLVAYVDSLSISQVERRALHARIAAIHRSKTEHYTRLIREGRVPLLVSLRSLNSSKQKASRLSSVPRREQFSQRLPFRLWQRQGWSEVAGAPR